jgi:hypothetical protein
LQVAVEQVGTSEINGATADPHAQVVERDMRRTAVAVGTRLVPLPPSDPIKTLALEVGEALVAVAELDRLRRGYGAVQQIDVVLSHG